ncbi:CocE/NonD family hydrolase [Mesorhizobium sp. M0500]|uniref:CocE/NonD family hydrolase n=1 Tax=Mesorhizobium sp. M0500 TaxID=2956953 RepID=UPI00333C1FE0
MTVFKSNMEVAAPATVVADSLQSPNGDIRLLPSVKVPMRDGVNLSTDIYLPKGPGPFPIILIRTPYNKNIFRPVWVAQATSAAVLSCTAVTSSAQHQADAVPHLIAAGYAVVIQDRRGVYESEGGAYNQARPGRVDFEDTTKWLDAQPWSARRMGMHGCSALGNEQVLAAVTDTKSLKAITPNGVPGAIHSAPGFQHSGRASYRGGAFEFASMIDWISKTTNWMEATPDPNVDPVTWARFSHFFNLKPDYRIDVDKIMWELPLLGMLDRAGLPPTEWDTIVSNRPESSYWTDKDSELIKAGDNIYTPSLWLYNWNDYLSGEQIQSFQWAKDNASNATARDNQYLIMGPGYHCDLYKGGSENEKIDDLDPGDTRLPIWDIMLKWNDRWVKGDVHAFDGIPKVTYWLYGKNEWRTSTDMPVPGTRYRDLYLSSQKGANSTNGDGKLSFDRPNTDSRDTYRYDPADPVPTGGEHNWAISLRDQRPMDARNRNDVLVYTTEPLKEGLTVVGPIKMVLYVASSAVDTDFTGKLVDVYPDGRAIQLQLGILRVRYRSSFVKPEMMTPGKTYEITVELNATGNWFAPGHRIQLEVSSSNFPRFDRNLNTGGDGYTETEGVAAQNTVFSGPSTPSRLVLPIAPD